MSPPVIRSVNEEDRAWIEQTLVEHWGATRVVSRGQVHQAELLPGFLALDGRFRVGLVKYHIVGDQCEIVCLRSLREGMFIGSKLLDCVKEVARAAGCRRMWLITTNDNMPALGFYQKRGWRLAAVYRGALEESRRLKPELPLVGLDGIPLCDEIELELLL